MPTGSEIQARRVRRYCRSLDRLSFFRERRAEGEAARPVHRALSDPEGGAPSPMVIHQPDAGGRRAAGRLSGAGRRPNSPLSASAT
jgi:hypothetical protein